MKKIGFIIDNDFYRDQRVRNEVNILAEKYHIFVLCFTFSRKKKIFPQENKIWVQQIYLPRTWKNILFGMQNTFPLYDWLWGVWILKFILKFQLQSIHVHDLFMAKAGFWAKQKTGLPLILDLHENYPEAIKTYSWANRGLKKYLAQPQKWTMKEKTWLTYPDKIVVVYEGFKQLLLQKYSFLKPENIVVYDNVPHLEEFSAYPIEPQIFPKENKFLLLYFGIISRSRGIVTCVEALNILRKKYPQLHLLLIGPITKAEKKNFASLFLHDEQITHYDWKDLKYLPSYLHLADVCINPLLKNPHHESTFANKIYQYASGSKPIIVSDCKPLKDFIEEHQCGLSFQAENPNDLAEKIEFLLQNPAQGKILGENGRQAVLTKFNLNVLKNRLFDLYNAEI